MTSPTRSPAEEKRILLLVFLTVFIDLIGFGIIIPIQPFFAEMLGASPAVVTLLGASFSLMQFLFAPFWGRLSDRFGRRPILLMSIAVDMLGYVLFALSHQLWTLFASRMLAGFGAANIATAQAIIADVTPAERRAKGMGLIGAAFGLGFIFGPALGGGLGQISVAAPAYAAAALCAVNWIFAFLVLPETLPKNESASHDHKRAWISFSAIREAARHAGVAQILTLYFFFTTAFSLMEQVLGLFIERIWLPSGAEVSGHAKHAAALTTYALIVIGFTSTLVQGGLIGRLAKRFGERQLLVAGTALVGISFCLIPVSGWAGSFAFLLGVSVLLALGMGVTNPSMSSLLSRSVDSGERGSALGIGQSLSALGRVIGPSMAGVLFEAAPSLPFGVGAALLFLCSAVAFSLPRPKLSR